MYIKIIKSVLPILLYYSSSVLAQQELIGIEPEDRGKLRTWKIPDLLPEKYAKDLKYYPVTYGEKGLRPLSSTSFSFKIHDWNQDGIGDIVGCNYPFHQGDPYLLVYESSGGENPIFTDPHKAQVILTDSRIGRYFDFMDIDGDGKSEIISFENTTKGILAFKNIGDGKTPKWEIFQIMNDMDKPWAYLQDVLKTPPFTVVDWDQDGLDDLIIGTNHPSVMVHGFGSDPRKMSPEAFRMYLVKNIGTKKEAKFGKPQMFTDKFGDPIKFLGFAYPMCFDVNGDGRPDLVPGEHKPGTRILINIDNDFPKVEEIGHLLDQEGRPLTDVEYYHHEVGDITGDGKNEIVSTTQFSGTTYYYPLFQTQEPQKWEAKEFLKFEGDIQTPIYGPAICTIEPVDWDSDGDTDLLLGAEPGIPMILINTGTDKKPSYANPARLKFYDGSPLVTHCIDLGDGSSHGAWEWYDDRSLPTLADWDGDGILDILSGTAGRRVYWMKGKIIEEELRFSKPKIFNLGLHPHRCKPAAYDWDNDGKLDLFALNLLSEIVIYQGNQNNRISYVGTIYPKTTEGKPLVADLSYVEPRIHTSLSGRTSIELFDWDNDGHMDIITHKHRGTVLYYRNTGSKEGIFEPARPMFDLDSHLAGPSVMDYNQDGYPDIVVGGDRKRYVGEKKLFPNPIRAQLMWYDGKSLPFPSKKR